MKDVVNITRDFNNQAEFIESAFFASLPNGLLYTKDLNSNLYKILYPVFELEYKTYLTTQKVLYDLKYIEADNQFLNQWLATYGLPNELFPQIKNTQEAVFAISLMKSLKNIVNYLDFENLMKILGYNVLIFPAEQIKEHFGVVGHKIPLILHEPQDPLNPFTYFYSVEEVETSQPTNIPSPIPMPILKNYTAKSKVEPMIEKIKPIYIILNYIEWKTALELKDLYR